MKMTADAGFPTGASDAELVAGSLQGDREAFARIVGRYQALVCSLAYSSTGSLTQSEDLAQETFATAWQHLAGLREPAKLRPWLCGLARNLCHRSHRGLRREPAHGAESLEGWQDLRAPEPLPGAQAISREEEGILWRSLERIPETYREPLILFYRQHESVEQVARALEISEEAVRQRLVRGRKLLQEEFLAFVEGALARTSPGPAFTAGVMAALPVLAASAQAAALGAPLATTGAAAKGAATLGSVGGGLAMLGGAWVTARAVADNTKSPRERKFIFSVVGLQFGLVCLYLASRWAVIRFAFPRPPFGPASRLTAGYLWPNLWLALGNFIFSGFTIGLTLYRSRRQRQIQIEEKTFDESEWDRPGPSRESATGLSGKKLNSGRRFAQLMAFTLVMLAVTLSQLSWKFRLGPAVALFAAVGVGLFLLWRFSRVLMRRSPRFTGWSSPAFTASVGVSILIAALTLYSFNGDERIARAHPSVLLAASPAEVTAFNVVVILVYALLIGAIFWLRRRYGAKL